jgi:transposase-like protein
MTMHVAENIDAQTKAIIVLESLSGRSVADICEEYGIKMTQFWGWRKAFLLNSIRVFEPANKQCSDLGRQGSIASLRSYIDDIVRKAVHELGLADFKTDLEPKQRYCTGQVSDT